MPRGRIYSAALSLVTGELILPWASLVMASLLLKNEAMKPIDICLDLTNGEKSKATPLSSQVNNSLKKLEEFGFVQGLSDRRFKPTARGRKEFQNVLDRATNYSTWSSLSDSKLM